MPTAPSIDPANVNPLASPNQAVTDYVGVIITVILALAAIVAVFYVIWAGWQYITSAGSPDKAKAARATLVNAVIGIVIIVAAYFIVRFGIAASTTIANAIP